MAPPDAARAAALVLLGAALAYVALQTASAPLRATAAAAVVEHKRDGGAAGPGCGAATPAPPAAGADDPPFVDPSGTCTDYHQFTRTFRHWLRYWRCGTVTSDNVTALLFGTYDSYGAVPDAQVQAEAFIAQSRVQFVGGRVYYMRNPAGYDYRARAQDVALQLVELAPWAAARGIVLPDVDLAYNVHDGPAIAATIPLPAPTHAMATSPIYADVPIPDMSFREWLDENGRDEEARLNYSRLMPLILAAGDHAAAPYVARIPRAVFRGSVAEAYVERSAAAALAALHPEVLDFVGAPLSLRNHSAYAVVIAIPGNGWMARLKYAMASGSPVVVLQEGVENGMWAEWWYHLLTPFVHYWPIRCVGELLPAVRHLLAHPSQAAAVGAAGREFVATQLSPERVRCYWAYYLTFLASVFAPGGVRAHPWAVRVDAAGVPAGRMGAFDGHFDWVYFAEWFTDRPPVLPPLEEG